MCGGVRGAPPDITGPTTEVPYFLFREEFNGYAHEYRAPTEEGLMSLMARVRADNKARREAKSC